MNKVVLMGRLTAAPELKSIASGKSVLTFSVAVDRPRAKDQQQKATADFINCVAWEKVAEFIAKWFRKGERILIEGRIQTRSYDSNGQKRWATEVIVHSAEFCESKSAANTAADNMGTDVSADDIPF